MENRNAVSILGPSQACRHRAFCRNERYILVITALVRTAFASNRSGKYELRICFNAQGVISAWENSPQPKEKLHSSAEDGACVAFSGYLE